MANDRDPQRTYSDSSHICPPPLRERMLVSCIAIAVMISSLRLESSRSSNAIHDNLKNVFLVRAKHPRLTLERVEGAEWEEAHAHNAEQEEARIYARVTGSFDRLLDDYNGILKEHTWSFESSPWRL